MTERKPLYQSPDEKGKRGFEDLVCYQLALEVMAKTHVFSETEYDVGLLDEESEEK